MSIPDWTAHVAALKHALAAKDRVATNAAVTALPDPEWGETPVAAVIPKAHVSDQDALTVELAALCRAELAGYKQPRRFVFRREFPLGPAGKILKREIANQVNHVSGSGAKMPVSTGSTEERR